MASHQSMASQGPDLRVSQSSGFLVGAGLAVAMAFCLVGGALSGPDVMPDSLAVRINPNTASVASLTRLPGIGWTRARAIVAYRDRVGRQTPDAVAFRSLGDLQRVGGIGPRTAEGLAPWLRFD